MSDTNGKPSPGLVQGIVRRPGDWVVALDGTCGGNAYMLVCRRCGATLKPSLPICVNDYCKIVKVFERQHAKCVDTPSALRGER